MLTHDRCTIAFPRSSLLPLVHHRYKHFAAWLLDGPARRFQRHDANRTGSIELDELVEAVAAWLAGLPPRARARVAAAAARDAAAADKKSQQGARAHAKAKPRARRAPYDASKSRCMKHHLAKNAKTFAIFRATGMHPEILEQLLSPIESPIVQRGMFKGTSLQNTK